MTIHKSKGLEFPICYFVGMNKSFNMHDIKEKFILTNNYGLIAPYYENGIGQTIYMDLLKNDYLVDEISEKIRLLYVALTRAKEKIIIVVPNTDKQINSIKKCKSFANFLTFIDDKIDNFKTKIDIDSLKTDNLKFDLGAGKVVVNNLIVKNDAHIEGGAGTIDILDGSISNLDLEIGVGALSLTSKLLGDSKIECGVGKVDIKLLGKKDDYKFNFSKGLGSMSLNSINIDNDFIYGTGINVIDIEGGVGAIKVFVDE